MNYNKLRYFYEVTRTLNLTRAARDLYISQPALSRHMADLEADLGVPLLVLAIFLPSYALAWLLHRVPVVGPYLT